MNIANQISSIFSNKYNPLTFDENNTLYTSSLTLLKQISDYSLNKKYITLKKGTRLFHSSSFDENLNFFKYKEFKFPIKDKTYFALTRDSAIAVQFFKKMKHDDHKDDDDYDGKGILTPQLGFVLEFEITTPIILHYLDEDEITQYAITETCDTTPEQLIGFYGDKVIAELVVDDTYRNFFNGMIELCLKQDTINLKLIKIHLINVNRNDIEDAPHILADTYDKIYNCNQKQRTARKFLVGDYKKKYDEETYKEYEPYLDPYICSTLYGSKTHIEWFTKNKNKINFDNYVLDLSLIHI